MYIQKFILISAYLVVYVHIYNENMCCQYRKTFTHENKIEQMICYARACACVFIHVYAHIFTQYVCKCITIMRSY